MAVDSITPSTQAYLDGIGDNNQIAKDFYSSYLQKADTLDSAIRQQSQSMNASREKIGMANELLAALRTAEKSNPTSNIGNIGSNSSVQAVLAKYPQLGGSVANALSFLGVSTTDSAGSAMNLSNLTGPQLSALEDNVKTRLNALNNTSQEDLFTLQQNTNQLTQLYELMTNFMSKMGTALQGILGNVRS